MVVAVRCPAQSCRKFMLVEDADRGKVVACLICKSQIQVPSPSAAKNAAPSPLPPPPPPAAPLPVAKLIK